MATNGKKYVHNFQAEQTMMSRIDSTPLYEEV